MTNIVTIGGGTGAPIILKALILAGFSDIKAISASTDSGGKTGIIRSDERDRVIAISDLLRSLLSLLPDSARKNKSIDALYDLFAYTDGRNRNLGYTIYYALLEKYHGNHQQAQKHIENLLGTNFYGQAIPVTSSPANIKFVTETNDLYQGEHELDRLSMSKNKVKDIWLEPKVTASDDAIQAIKNADFLILCPGSLYGSVLVNFLPTGIKEAYQQSNAKKILVTNLVSDRNQTHNFNLSKYIKIIQKYTHEKHPIHIVVAPDISTKKFNSTYPIVAKRYRLEHSYFIGKDKYPKTDISLDTKIITSDIFSLTEKLNRIRHDPQKLSVIFKKILKY